MLLDRRHVPWMLVVVLATLVSGAGYLWYVREAAGDVRGGTAPGLAFGIAAGAIMIFEGLLSLRKRLPGWPLGSASSWLRAHIWLGLLTLPLVFFHSGFRWGGSIERWLMAVFLVVIASGIAGLAVQQLLPRLMKAEVPSQAIAGEIPIACRRLLQSADALVEKATGSLFDLQGGTEEAREVKALYVEHIRPFLDPKSARNNPLRRSKQAEQLFARLRYMTSPALAPLVDQLEGFCNERRQLILQGRLHRWLHGWLAIHIPLCWILLVLGLLHVVTALYY